MSEFSFRLIDLPDGNQVIDCRLRTPYNSLTATQMMEYIEIDNLLYAFEQQKKREKKETERQQRIARNPLLRLACLCGLF